MSEKLLGRNCSWCSWATPSETRRNLDLCDSCAEHFDDGATNERERIVALLESLKCACDGECGMVEAPFTVLERLIKGENE